MHENDANAAGGAVDWAAVREVYEAGEVPVWRILADHGITHWQLKQRYRAEGWNVRPQVAQPGRPALMRRPVEAAMILIARLIEAHVERLLAAPEGAAAALPAPEAELSKITDMAKVLEGLGQVETLRRQLVRRAARGKALPGRAAASGRDESSAKSAMDGGRSKEEEAEAADVEWMRTELKRQVAILRRSAGLDGADRPAGEGGA